MRQRGCIRATLPLSQQPCHSLWELARFLNLGINNHLGINIKFGIYVVPLGVDGKHIIFVLFCFLEKKKVCVMFPFHMCYEYGMRNMVVAQYFTCTSTLSLSMELLRPTAQARSATASDYLP